MNDSAGQTKLDDPRAHRLCSLVLIAPAGTDPVLTQIPQSFNTL